MRSQTSSKFWFSCLLWAAVGFCFRPAAVNAQTQKDSPESKVASVSMSVVDEAGGAIEGANATLFEWTGKFERCPQSQPVLKDGRFTFSEIDTEKVYYLYVRADGYAPSMQSLVSLTAGENREIQFKMSRPAVSWIDVVDIDGKPVEGAEIERLQYTDANKNDVYLMPESKEGLGIEFKPSDSSGRLQLPPLPKNFKCSVTIIHPDWKANVVRDVPAVDGLLTSLTLSPGIRVVCELKQSENDKILLDGQKVKVNLTSSIRSPDVPADLRFEFPIKDNRISFTVHPVEFQHLSFKLKSHLVTPDFSNNAVTRDKRLDLQSASVQTFCLDLKPKITASGRVVDTDGKGVPGAYVSTEIAVNDSVPWRSESNVGKDRFANGQWASSGSDETDANGNYEVELAAGKVNLDLIREGYFSDPALLEFIVPADKEFKIRELTLYPVPKLRGKVVDSEGRPVSQAYVRMRHSGWGDADPVAESAAEGTFELKLERIPYSAEELGILTNVSVVAFNAKTGAGGVAVVNLKDAKSCEEILVKVEPRSADWLMEVVEPFQIVAKDERRKLLEQARQQYPGGIEGKEVPLMGEGTWLNTSAKSLADFRGKYVLLDFWFIGCGPCHRDMPSIRMAHRHFADLGFSVVSVHKDGELPKDVQSFADKNEMRYPIVVDDAEGTITNQFRSIGLTGFPSYILLDPEGRILHNDATSEGLSLRQYKIEKINQAIRNARN